MPLRFGPTLPASTVNDGLDRWISSWAEFRASRSAWPASGRGATTSDGFGRTSGVGFARSDQQLSFSKTFLGSSGMDCPSCSTTLPKRGSMRSGVVSARPTLERPTGESGYSSSAFARQTPNASNYGSKTGHDGERKPFLAQQAQAWPTPTTNDSPPSQAERNTPPHSVAACNWPTPRAEDSEATGAHRGTPDTLTSASRQWQTPATDSFRSRGGERKDEMGLDQQARMWATPRASPQENRATRVYGTNTGIKHAEGLAQQAGSFRPDRGIERNGGATSEKAVLNPRFVEALMGLPDGWTMGSPLAISDYTCWAMQSSHSVRRSLSSRLRTHWDSIFREQEHDDGP